MPLLFSEFRKVIFKEIFIDGSSKRLLLVCKYSIISLTDVLLEATDPSWVLN